MATKFFGQYLLEKGLINKDQLLATLDEQRTQNPRIGYLAVAEGFISMAQAKQINQRQISTDARFGDLAIFMGLIDSEQLDHLVELQSRKRKFFGELLIELKYLDAETVAAELQMHQLQQRKYSSQIQGLVENHNFSQSINTSVNIACKLFTRILLVPARFSALATGQDLEEYCDSPLQLSSITIESVKDITLSIVAEENLMLEIASRLIGIDRAEVDLDLGVDATGEFLNILVGYYAKETIPQDCSYNVTPPDYEQSFVDFIDDQAEICGLKMESELGGFLLCISR